MKCDNCFNEAVYTHSETGVSPANYCGNCLPHWLQDRAIAGHFPLVTPVSEKAPVEEAPVEDKPKKKATAKSTAVQE